MVNIKMGNFSKNIIKEIENIASLVGIVEPSLLAESLQFLGPVSVHSVSVDLRATLVKLRLRGARNIIIDTSVDNLPSVTQATLDTGMMTKSYTYIFTMLVSWGSGPRKIS